MKLDIKICGLKTAEAVDRSVARGASHIGFNFFPKSPRFIEPDRAGTLADRVRGRTKIVAVTVDSDTDELDEIVALLKPDMLQLHGRESPERMLTLKALYGLPLIKALAIKSADDIERIDPFVGIADRFLFDAKPPAGSELPGGNGVSFDWTLLRGLPTDLHYFLSGGLRSDNVAAALAETGARGLDVSSGVESAPGEKDPDMIGAFFDAAEKASMARLH